MGIGSIGQYGGIHSGYQGREITKAGGREQEIQETAPVSPAAQETGQTDDVLRQDAQPAEAAGEKEVPFAFHPASARETIGRDRDLLSLDMQKAISDMKKDSILEDYQYFVGSSGNLREQDEGLDGFVFVKSAT